MSDLSLNLVHPNLILEVLSFLDVQTIERKFVELSPEFKRFVTTYLDRFKVLNIISESQYGYSETLWSTTILGFKPTGMRVLTEFNLNMRHLSTAAMMSLQHLDLKYLTRINWSLMLEPNTMSYYIILFTKLLRAAGCSLRSMKLTVQCTDFGRTNVGNNRLLSLSLIETLRLEELSLTMKGQPMYVENFLEIVSCSSTITKLAIDLRVPFPRSLELSAEGLTKLQELEFHSIKVSQGLYTGLSTLILQSITTLQKIGISEHLAEVLSNLDILPHLKSLKLFHLHRRAGYQTNNSPLTFPNEGDHNVLPVRRTACGLSKEQLMVFLQTVLRKAPKVEEIAAVADVSNEDALFQFYENLAMEFPQIQKLNIIPLRVSQRAADKIAKMLCEKISESGLLSEAMELQNPCSQLQEVCWIPVRAFLENSINVYRFDPNTANQIFKVDRHWTFNQTLVEALFRYSFPRNRSVCRVTFSEDINLEESVMKARESSQFMSISSHKYVLDRDYLSGKTKNHKGSYLEVFEFSNSTLALEVQAIIILTFIQGNPRIKTLRIGDFHLSLEVQMISQFLRSLTEVISLEIGTSTLENAVTERILTNTLQDHVENWESLQSSWMGCALPQNSSRVSGILNLRTVKLVDNQMMTDYSRDSSTDIVEITKMSYDQIISLIRPQVKQALSRFALVGFVDEIVCVNLLSDIEDLALFVKCCFGTGRTSVTKFISSNLMLWRDMINHNTAPEIVQTCEKIKAFIAWQCLQSSSTSWQTLEYFWFSYHCGIVNPIHLCALEEICDPSQSADNKTCTCEAKLRSCLNLLSEEIKAFHLAIPIALPIATLVRIYTETLLDGSKKNLCSLGILDVSCLRSQGIMKRSRNAWGGDIDEYRCLTSEDPSNKLYIYILLKEIFDLNYEEVGQDLLTKLSFAKGVSPNRRYLEEFIWEMLSWCELKKKETTLQVKFLRHVQIESLNLLRSLVQACNIGDLVVADNFTTGALPRI
eukprot:CAMPEP_0115042888 /NCGR_PEP_ID=MMETSP0216-20121206/46535_1 /TAXON_ID=223996 /ORGANISM="Protocruzia adherens, Strain Boccale" /LENGTH=988 /DNA_ID=CAMNT_0002425091 /DNA_START=264 /DNA_END=3230 /DNA_ORIENTATION=+